MRKVVCLPEPTPVVMEVVSGGMSPIMLPTLLEAGLLSRIVLGVERYPEGASLWLRAFFICVADGLCGGDEG